MLLNKEAPPSNIWGSSMESEWLQVSSVYMDSSQSYLGRNISFTETDVSKQIGKAWTAVNKLSTT